MRRCKVCQRANDAGKFCSEACEVTAANMTAAHRNGPVAKRHHVPTIPEPVEYVSEPESPGWDIHGYKLDIPEPCVMYGLLTAGDVTELERRRAKAVVMSKVA